MVRIECTCKLEVHSFPQTPTDFRLIKLPGYPASKVLISTTVPASRFLRNAYGSESDTLHRVSELPHRWAEWLTGVDWTGRQSASSSEPFL